MKRIAPAAALCALAGCAVPIHTQAQAQCETRVKRITNFEAAYFEYRLNKRREPARSLRRRVQAIPQRSWCVSHEPRRGECDADLGA